MPIEDKVRHMFYDPMENGINMVNPREKYRKMGVSGEYDLKKAINEARSLIEHPSGNPYQQLIRYRKITPVLLKLLESDLEDWQMEHRQVERFSEVKFDNSNKRWNKEEDEMLINAACDDNNSLYEISTRFGRSPAAIQTRISYLVGIKRISTEIAGKFIGTLDGKEVDGNIKGTLRKE